MSRRGRSNFTRKFTNFRIQNTKYRDTQQEINFAIKEIFEKEGIEMAFPTQTIFINSEKT
ncbi:MAG: mechanosensitive ion channel family protein [Thermoplasmatales archaeon]|nr:mechanosensitive ion channel family protein [Thermoplasmatales archaeon]